MKKMVISWGEGITRSTSLANEMSALDLHFKPFFKNRKMKVFNYFLSSLKMFYSLFKHKPDLVVVALPPVFLLYIVFFYRIFHKVDVVADLHNGVLRSEWAYWPFLSFLLKKCKSVLAHNYQIQKKINSRFCLSDNSQVLTDPLKKYSFSKCIQSNFIKEGKFNVLVPVSYAKDEPIDEIVEAAGVLEEDFNFILTGNFQKMFTEECAFSLPVTFTGFISAFEYDSLMNMCDLTLCLTKDDEIQMCAVIESISANKIFICTNNTVNKELFSDYYFSLVDCGVDSIVNGLMDFKSAPPERIKVTGSEIYKLYWKERFDALF